MNLVCEFVLVNVTMYLLYILKKTSPATNYHCPKADYRLTLFNSVLS